VVTPPTPLPSHTHRMLLRSLAMQSFALGRDECQRLVRLAIQEASEKLLQRIKTGRAPSIALAGQAETFIEHCTSRMAWMLCESRYLTASACVSASRPGCMSFAAQRTEEMALPRKKPPQEVRYPPRQQRRTLKQPCALPPPR
jgi:hypothetical protein